MSIAIMQPYFFPYFAYFQLMHTVDVFVIADDLNYIKNGFINKNSILLNNQVFKISLQLKAASQNKLINEIEVGENGSTLLETIRRTYRKAPYFEDVFPMIEKILLSKEKNLSKYLGNSLFTIARYLDIPVKILYLSEIEKDNELRLDERIYDVCKKLNKMHYVNSIGGQSLYKKEMFLKHGIQLSFIQSNEIIYKQYNNVFIPNLSIIDVLMFNSKSHLNEMLNAYSLV